MDLRLDTRNAKPKLSALNIWTMIALAIIVILNLLNAEKYVLASVITVLVYSIGMTIMLVVAFFEQMRYNLYSYNTIFYIGFALFSLSVDITFGFLTHNILRHPEYYGFVNAIIYAIIESAKSYIILSFPFLLIFSLGLSISNIELIKREGKSLVNLLGIVLSVLVVAGVIFLFFFNYYASGSQFEVMIHDLVTNLFATIYLYFECMLIGTMIATAIAARYEPKRDKDFLIILGCGLLKDGTPTPLLKGRLDRALSFDKKQREETGKRLVFVTSGGQGPDEIISESASMKRYLMEHGIEEERIIEEDQSTDTYENMRNSKAKIQEVNPNAKIAFSTTNYHVFRSGLFARRVKMRAIGMGAKTKWYFWPNAAVREFVGLLTKHLDKQLAILISMVVFYLFMTIYLYR